MSLPKGNWLLLIKLHDCSGIVEIIHSQSRVDWLLAKGLSENHGIPMSLGRYQRQNNPVQVQADSRPSRNETV